MKFGANEANLAAVLKDAHNLQRPIEQKVLLRDTHGHLVVQHDLFNHDGLTKDGIAEAFEEFAAKEKLSFF